MATNVDLQLKAYDAAKKAEEAKKNTDPERVRELTKEYEALEAQWAEFKNSQLEDMGGVVDFRDATAGFVDAWREAFLETGNGLEGLKDNFKEFFSDIVKQQALTQGATNIMKQLFDEINKSLETDYTISEDEYKNIDDVQSKVLKELDAFLEHYPVSPKQYISYQREAFFGKDNKDFRLTFDRKLTERRYDLSLECKSYGNFIIEADQRIMEVKISDSMPDWLLHKLSELEIYKTSFSKYGRAYMSYVQEQASRSRIYISGISMVNNQKLINRSV
jgi:hypothetical protein